MLEKHLLELEQRNPAERLDILKERMGGRLDPKLIVHEITKVLGDLAAGEFLEVFPFGELDISRTLSIAHAEQITFYDASYIAMAESAEAKLVTEDEKLQLAATTFVGAITYSQLIMRLSKSLPDEPF